LCFLRQFRSSIQKSDYLALRLGFITEHRLSLSYDFHKYMVRSMEDEFHAILGISWPLWVYTIVCIFVNIHGNFPFRKS
ncbi:MLO-like protein 4-like, partial [Trifolium pratense]